MVTGRMADGDEITVWGEVLFDIFHKNKKVLGGAPFNVAWNLTGLGHRVNFISATGSDEEGEEVKAAMHSWGLSDKSLQTNEHPTGRVAVQMLPDGSHLFEIAAEQAYDYVEISDAIDKITPGSLLYHGTLALRREPLRQEFLKVANSFQRFVDVNLRAPWYEVNSVLELLQGVQIAKLNHEELFILTNNSNEAPDETQSFTSAALQETAQTFRQNLNIKTLIVTFGSAGAWVLDSENFYREAAPPIKDLVDTVGAGDAFSSMFLDGILKKLDMQKILERAIQFSALVCRQQGAVSQNKEIYQPFLTGES